MEELPPPGLGEGEGDGLAALGKPGERRLLPRGFICGDGLPWLAGPKEAGNPAGVSKARVLSSGMVICGIATPASFITNVVSYEDDDIFPSG